MRLDVSDTRDLALASRAVRQRWPITDANRSALARAVAAVVETAADNQDGDLALKAAGLMVTMEGQNQKDDHHDDRMRLSESSGQPDGVVYVKAIPEELWEAV